MAGRRTLATPETIARILGFFRQTGNLTNSAIRAGVAEATVFAWKARGEKAKAGLFREFVEALSRAREERIAALAVQHFHTSTGGVIQLPEYDNQRRVVVDKEGRPKMVPVVMLPNCKAMEWELAHMAPAQYGRQGKSELPAPPPPPSDRARPRDLQDMLFDVLGRLQARGIDFKPSIETTATRVEESAPADAGEPK